MNKSAFLRMLFLAFLTISMSCENIDNDLGDNFEDASVDDREPRRATLRRSCKGKFTIKCEEGGSGSASISNIAAYGYAKWPNIARNAAANQLFLCLSAWAYSRDKWEDDMNIKHQCANIDGVYQTWNQLKEIVRKKSPRCKRFSTKAESTNWPWDPTGRRCNMNYAPWGDGSP